MPVCVSADRQSPLPTKRQILRSSAQNGITQTSLVYCSGHKQKQQSIKKGAVEEKTKNKKKRRVAAFIPKKRMTRFLVS
jgi:hypothetical protein